MKNVKSKKQISFFLSFEIISLQDHTDKHNMQGYLSLSIAKIRQSMFWVTHLHVFYYLIFLT